MGGARAVGHKSALASLLSAFASGGTAPPEDYDTWKVNFGTSAAAAGDSNADGPVDAADYATRLWRCGPA